MEITLLEHPIFGFATVKIDEKWDVFENPYTLKPEHSITSLKVQLINGKRYAPRVMRSVAAHIMRNVDDLVYARFEDRVFD